MKQAIQVYTKCQLFQVSSFTLMFGYLDLFCVVASKVTEGSSKVTLVYILPNL